MKKAALFILVCLAAFAAFVAYHFATVPRAKPCETNMDCPAGTLCDDDGTCLIKTYTGCVRDADCENSRRCNDAGACIDIGSPAVEAKHTIVVRYWSEQAVPFDTISMAVRVVGMQESYEGADTDMPICGPKVKECEKTIRTDKDVKGVRLTIMGMAMLDGQMAILPYCFEPDEKDSKTEWELAGNVRVTLDGKEYPLVYRALTFEQDGQMHTQCAPVAAFSGEPPDVIND